jgi:hypothetical protein
MNELLAALEASALSTWVREASTLWAYPMIITMHTLGLAVLVGASTAVDLRVLGVAQQIEFTRMKGFFAAMWVGFWLNAATGALLFAADPRTTGVFIIKMGSVVVGVLLIALIRREVFDERPGPVAVPPVARAYAVLSLLAWVVATTTGRLMAYL